MSEMVERARLAFIERLRDTPAWEHAKKCDVADFRAAMVAAIAAMREPTEAMLAAGMAEEEVDLASEYRAMIAAALAEVHRSNMSKLGADGKPVLRDDGKILKGLAYTPPDLRALIEGEGQ